MYAIVTTGGKQYKVAKGDVIDVERLDAQPGDKVKLDVLMLSDGTQTVTGTADLGRKKVTCEVLEHLKDEKVLVFKLKKRKRYHRTKGHRQQLTRLEVSSLPRMAAASSEKPE
ncbi:large subunit ribosomal protein L21 [Olsenella profusa DSM 13989]|uniref:50S ribosomal protein L21 n=1 Tax=Olsenella profusa TaxID=138595 RepID=UPI00278AC5C1|nr:50S ribosomal protein L21 [Olsenella profusa]MDP9860418.1 large subunit ribosomal protein L21 [Olsenella profusa DSM 13989]